MTVFRWALLGLLGLVLLGSGVNIQVLKKLNGYKPFLYNFTTNACGYLKTKRNLLFQYFHELIAVYSNFNHSCPYNHDIIVEKLPINFVNHQVSVVLPVPEGEYLVHSVYTIRGKPRLEIKVFCRIF
ncbi:uncharacterized protein Dere_GG26865 [Drosophila erecta]|uniref:Uncharacterized protein n=1 Tax=Drosophila erecta TaxID=7220 RepID=A0A0Q5WJA4_DROER|nr:uncharacterized protein Dere_GG26865 [Drosophila erecta]